MCGPGNRANATLGRAVRLCLWNIGGARPGTGDMATQGSPAKYTYAIAEREDASPWGPLHAALGFEPTESVVTAFGGEAPHNVNDHVSRQAPNLLAVIADTAATLGSNVGWYLSQSQLLVVLGPEHAATIAADGFSRADVQRYLYEHARLPLHRMRQGGMWGIHDWPRWMQTADDHAWLPVVPGPEAILVMVAGGPGKHSPDLFSGGLFLRLNLPGKRRSFRVARSFRYDRQRFVHCHFAIFDSEGHH